jgi:hypothetical protein
MQAIHNTTDLTGEGDLADSLARSSSTTTASLRWMMSSFTPPMCKSALCLYFLLLSKHLHALD